MYQFSYAEIQTDSVADAKDRERQLLTRSIDLLSAARDTGNDSLERTEAVHFLTRIWTTFIGSRQRGQRPSGGARANLISIGLWLLREAEEIRQGRSDNIEGLIEVSQIIRDGIQ